MDHEALLRDLYAAFNARDVDAVIAALHPDVDWPNAFESGRIAGRDAVRDYWRRQFDRSATAWSRMDVIEPPEEGHPRARRRRPRA